MFKVTEVYIEKPFLLRCVFNNKEVRDPLINHPNKIQISEKPYDWLGHGAFIGSGIQKDFSYPEKKFNSDKRGHLTFETAPFDF